MHYLYTISYRLHKDTCNLGTYIYIYICSSLHALLAHGGVGTVGAPEVLVKGPLAYRGTSWLLAHSITESKFLHLCCVLKSGYGVSLGL